MKNKDNQFDSASKTKMLRLQAEQLVAEADTLRDSGEFDKALEKYNSAKEIDPTYAWIYIGLSHLYSSKHWYDKAILEVQEGLEHDQSEFLYESLGHAYVGIEQWKIAKKNFKKALSINPNLEYTLFGMGLVAENQNELDLAVEFYHKSIKLNPNYHWSIAKLGLISERKGNLQEAIKYLESANTIARREKLTNWEYDLNRVRALLKGKNQWKELPTIDEMIAYLDRFVKGQDLAKTTLAISIYNHYLSLAYQLDDPTNTNLGRHNILLFGPSGCGKTYMIELLTKKLSVPLVIVNAPSLVQTGYVGKLVDSIMQDLLVASEMDVKKAERGIVFIDEIDKVRKQGGSGPDVSGEGVQNSLLTMLEGKDYYIETYAGQHAGERYIVDSSKVLFICAGAFDGILDFVKDKNKSGLGFNSKLGNVNASDVELLDQVTVNELQKYGILPQLSGRFTYISKLNNLTSQDLKDILFNMEDSILKRYQDLFALHNIKLEVTEDAVDEIIKATDVKLTGARSLRSSLAKAIRIANIKINQYVNENITRVVIDKDVVSGISLPKTYPSSQDFSISESEKLRKSIFAV